MWSEVIPFEPPYEAGSSGTLLVGRHHLEAVAGSLMGIDPPRPQSEI